MALCFLALNKKKAAKAECITKEKIKNLKINNNRHPSIPSSQLTVLFPLLPVPEVLDSLFIEAETCR